MTNQEWAQPERIAEYLARELPFRADAEDLVVAAMPARIDSALDLGCGDGRLTAVLRERCGADTVIALDNSAPMLARASARFASDPAVSVQAHDLAVPLSHVLGRGDFDAVVSGLAIHHLSHQRKQALFGEIAQLLRQGGVFANLDLVSAPSAEEHQRFRRAIRRERDDPADVLAPLGDQLAWLERAGFSEVDCRFKWMQLTLFTAVR